MTKHAVSGTLAAAASSSSNGGWIAFGLDFFFRTLAFLFRGSCAARYWLLFVADGLDLVGLEQSKRKTSVGDPR